MFAVVRQEMRTLPYWEKKHAETRLAFQPSKVEPSSSLIVIGLGPL